MTGSLIVVSAPSGAGKTSLTHAAIDQLAAIGQSVMFSVSYTTRAPRPGEVDGRDYHFVDETRFRAMIDDGEFLEHAKVFDRRYGTGRAVSLETLAAGHDLILDIDWQGAQQVKAAMPTSVSVYILPPSREALAQRLAARAQDDAETIARRMAQAAAETSHWAEYDYLIVNDDFDTAVADLVAVFRAARLRRELVADGPVGALAQQLASCAEKP